MARERSWSGVAVACEDGNLEMFLRSSLGEARGDAEGDEHADAVLARPTLIEGMKNAPLIGKTPGDWLRDPCERGVSRTDPACEEPLEDAEPRCEVDDDWCGDDEGLRHLPLTLRISSARHTDMPSRGVAINVFFREGSRLLACVLSALPSPSAKAMLGKPSSDEGPSSQ